MAAAWVLLTIGFQFLFSISGSVPSTTDYITGNADKTRSTTAMRLFTWKVAGHMAENHLFFGVGADNFGLAFNTSRADLASKQPAAGGQEIAEDYVVERAHNELFQVLDELGIVGASLLIAVIIVFVTFLLKRFRRNHLRLSPMLWATISGMAAFGCSSMVSSFSYRAIQNGIPFMMVFAIAIYQLSKPLKKRSSGSALAMRCSINLYLCRRDGNVHLQRDQSRGRILPVPGRTNCAVPDGRPVLPVINKDRPRQRGRILLLRRPPRQRQ